MTDGVVAELNELINLRRYVQLRPYKPKSKSTRHGSHFSKVRGRGMDFAEVRNYQAGDDIRHMEWRMTARSGRPHVKVYEEERERPVVICADFNPSMIFGTRVAFKSVVAAHLASLLAWTVMKQGDRIGGFFFSAHEHSEFTPRGRDLGVLPLLASLSHYTAQPANQDIEPRRLSDALIRLRRVLRPGSTLILISDFYAMDTECEKHLNRLRAHNDIMAYHICDAIELHPPKPQQYAITNGQKDLVWDTGLKRVRQAYEQYTHQRIEQIKKQFKGAQIPYIQVTSEMDLPALVRQTFPRRAYG